MARSRVTIRRATPADEPFLRSVFADRLEEYFLLEADVRSILLDMQYRGAKRRLETEHPFAERFVIVLDGVGVGSLTFDRSTGDTEILDLSVARTLRRRGIGSAALSAVPEGPMSATVLARDRETRSLYERMGFRVAEESRGRVTLRGA